MHNVTLVSYACFKDSTCETKYATLLEILGFSQDVTENFLLLEYPKTSTNNHPSTLRYTEVERRSYVTLKHVDK
jgi:hypothetical protein